MQKKLSLDEYIDWLGKMRVEVSEKMHYSCVLTHVYEQLYWLEMDARSLAKMSGKTDFPPWRDEPRVEREKTRWDETKKNFVYGPDGRDAPYYSC